MSLTRMPLLVWTHPGGRFMIVFAMPAVMIASTCLALDRLVGTHFFNHAEGGDPLLWQHMFWFFGHPEVYIIFIPGLGMISSMLPTFTRRKCSATRRWCCRRSRPGSSASACGCTTCSPPALPQLGQSFFTASSLIITIPTGVQIFCWLATIWGGRSRFATPLLYVLGFFATSSSAA